jgi:hypothetical protein
MTFISSLKINNARVAKLADAPDLGLSKSSISKQGFSFQKAIVLRCENAFLLESPSYAEWRVETPSF